MELRPTELKGVGLAMAPPQLSANRKTSVSTFRICYCILSYNRWPSMEQDRKSKVIVYAITTYIYISINAVTLVMCVIITRNQNHL